MKEKNIYRESRNNTKHTQASAGEAAHMSEDKIANIESGKTIPRPEDVYELSIAYGDPFLCNKYCSTVCKIGQNVTPTIEIKELPQLTVSILASLNSISSETNRILEIAEDGVVSEDELKDFQTILKKLDKIELSITALKLWAKKAENME